MKRSKHTFLMIACIVLAIIPEACSPSVTNILVIQGPLQETDSPPIIRTFTLKTCRGAGASEFETSYSQVLNQNITLSKVAAGEGGTKVKISEAVEASLTAKISETYQQQFSMTSSQMDKFRSEAKENAISVFKISLKEYQAKSTVSYTEKVLFFKKDYSVPYTYSLYVPGAVEIDSTKCPGDATRVEVPRPLRIEAENYAEASSHAGIADVGLTECSEGGRLLGWINSGEWVSYEHVAFSSGGYKTFQARIASAEQGGEIDIRLDGVNGQSIGVCQAPATGDWQNWTTITCTINSDVTGEKTIYLLFRGQGDYLYNINWFEFIP